MPHRDTTASKGELAAQLAVALEPTLDPSSAGPQTSADVQVTQRLGRFVLLRQLGSGGMGSVFAAYDEQLDRKVALKLLHQSSTVTSEHRLRVLREAQAMARVSHPNVVHVYEVGEVGGRIFIAMEFIDGSTLSSWQQAQPRSWQEVLSMYRQAADGLFAAHRNGLVHRDFKPDNVLVDPDGRVHVADFGLARLHSHDPAGPTKLDGARASSGVIGTSLTLAGAISGTPGYMSPEQYRGEKVDSRSDQFSFCVSLYQALFGRLPFAGETLAEQSANVLAGRMLPPPEDTLVPLPIRRAIEQGLAVDPEARFPSMNELVAALTKDTGLDPSAAKAARRKLTLAISIVTMLLVVATVVKLVRGGITLRLMVIIAAVIDLMMLGVILGFRRSFMRHAFHRRVFMLLLVTTTAWLGVRCLGLALHLEVTQMIPIDLMVVGGLYATIAYEYLPGVWWFSGSAMAGGIVSVLLPQHAERIYVAVYSAVAFIISLSWERVSNQRKALKPSENQPPAPTSR